MCYCILYHVERGYDHCRPGRISSSHNFQRLGLDWRLVLLAFAPFGAYLLVFKHYVILRELTGHSPDEKPSIDTLPWLEEVSTHAQAVPSSPSSPRLIIHQFRISSNAYRTKSSAHLRAPFSTLLRPSLTSSTFRCPSCSSRICWLTPTVARVCIHFYGWRDGSTSWPCCFSSAARPLQFGVVEYLHLATASSATCSRGLWTLLCTTRQLAHSYRVLTTRLASNVWTRSWASSSFTPFTEVRMSIEWHRYNMTHLNDSIAS